MWLHREGMQDTISNQPCPFLDPLTTQLLVWIIGLIFQKDSASQRPCSNNQYIFAQYVQLGQGDNAHDV